MKFDIMLYLKKNDRWSEVPLFGSVKEFVNLEMKWPLNMQPRNIKLETTNTDAKLCAIHLYFIIYF